jgi:hypothetical protein
VLLSKSMSIVFRISHLGTSDWPPNNYTFWL